MDNIVALKRRTKSRRDLIADAVDRGQPLPLTIMLDNLFFWVEETNRLEASTDPADRPIARIARHNAQRVAVDCAQFVHPKLSTQTIAGDEEQPLTVEHQHKVRLGADDLKGKSVKELGAIWLAMTSGDKQRLASLIPMISEQDDA